MSSRVSCLRTEVRQVGARVKGGVGNSGVGGVVVGNYKPDLLSMTRANSTEGAARIAGPSGGLAILRGRGSLMGHTDFAGIKWQPRLLLR
ncbi:hypothetical protein RV134_230050 [Roseovarius sp. EC-HK134]|nr:hypothetical protein RV134_230050 [Roseovarius sp. EC-HK134]VVT02975.1 hypothetical protein RV420_270051 [Roseovarius sp. EC-SD190]